MLLKKGLVHYKQGRFEEALACFTKAIGLLLNPPKSRTKKFLGIPITTRDRVSRLIGNDVDHSLLTVYAVRGHIYLKLNKYQECIDDLDKALQMVNEKADAIPFFSDKKGGTLASIYQDRSLAHVGLKQDENALADIDEAIRHDEESSKAYFLRMMLYTKLRRWDDVLADSDYVRELIQNDDRLIDSERQSYLSKAYYFEGTVLAGKGQQDEAIDAYTQAILIQPQGSSVYNSRGYYYSVLGKLEESLTDCNQAVELGTDSYSAYGSRGHTYFLMGEYEKALQDFEKSAQLKPDHKFALAGQAITHHAMGNVEAGKRLWQMVIDLDPAYQEADALQKEYDCADAFVEAARTLLA